MPERSGTPKPSKKKVKDDADKDLLEGAGNQRWTDNFLLLSGIRAVVEAIIARRNAKEDPKAAKAAAERKKKEEEEPALPLKTQVWNFMGEYKIPTFLVIVSFITCLIIAGGELGEQEVGHQRPRPDDYYGVLGVARDVDTPDLKRAYKTLARRWHPDKNPNCSSCADTFSKIAEAYETLVDEDKRSTYDQSGDIATEDLKSPRSVPLTRENFDELVTYSTDVWIVQIFKPKDGSSAQFHPFWENAIQKYGHLVRFGRVDLTNDLGKWLPVKVKVFPMVLKFGRHLGSPEIFPITAIHETTQVLQRFVLTSFPNIGLPLHQNQQALKNWLGKSTRKHKVLLAMPGKSEEERYKSHLMPRKLAARWSELFEFRSVETAALHRLPNDAVPEAIRKGLPAVDKATEEAAIFFLPSTAGAEPRGSRIVKWPVDEDDLVLELLQLAEAAAPALSARSVELMCRSVAVKRVYCLVLLDPPDSGVARAVQELEDSRNDYAKELQEIKENQADDQDTIEESDNFIVSTVRLFTQPRGLQPSVDICRAPLFGRVNEQLTDSKGFLLDMDTGRFAPLPGITSFRGIYPAIAYEETIKWQDEVFHPFLSLPDCNEGMSSQFFRTLRQAPLWEILVQLVTAFFLLEAVAKALVTVSWRWALGALGLLLMILLRSPPFLVAVSQFLPGSLFPPPPLLS